MRAIKFRIWDSVYKKWIATDEYVATCHGLSVTEYYPKSHRCIDADIYLYYNGGPRPNWVEAMKNQYVAQQFTGFLDQNFHEIYEGDLVSFYTPGHPRGPEKELYENMLVKFDEEYGAYEFVNGRGMGELCLSVFGDCIDTESFIITGNIFETK